MESAVRLAGGIQTLVDAIAAALPRGTIELKTRVTSIRQKEDGSLAIEVDGSEEEIGASAVVITVPPRMTARNIIFIPELSLECMRSLLHKPTWMASHAKVIASSSAFNIGDTEAIAAALHTPVPIPRSNDNDGSAFNIFPSLTVVNIANPITVISRISRSNILYYKRMANGTFQI